MDLFLASPESELFEGSENSVGSSLSTKSTVRCVVEAELAVLCTQDCAYR